LFKERLPISIDNKVIMRRIIEEGSNQGNLEVFDELAAPDLINHSAPPGIPPTREGWKQLTTMFRAAFPDLYLHIEDEIAEGDRIVTRFTAHGTHQGDLMGIPPTDKQVTVSGVNIARIAGGKIMERWEIVDMMSMMVQLGVVPPPEG
jgi:steroid delta-isomerase-like uncharacterized protein